MTLVAPLVIMGVVIGGGMTVLVGPLVVVNDRQVVMRLLGPLRGAVGMGGNVVMRELGRQGLPPGTHGTAEPAGEP